MQDLETKPIRSPKSRWFWGLTLLVVAAMGVGATRLDWPTVVAALSKTDPAWFAVACGLFSLLPVLMATEWRLIGARPADSGGGGMRTLLPLGCFTYFVQTYLNAAVAYGAAFLRLVRGQGWTVGQGIGLVTVDQLAEGISRLAFCGIVLSIAAGSMAASPTVWAAIGVAAIVVACYAGTGGKGLVHQLVAKRVARSGHAAAVLDEVTTILNVRSMAWGIALAIVKKVAKISAVLAIQQALGLEASLWTAVYFVAVLECATTLPLVPGQLGVIESAAVTVFVSQGLSAEAGLSVGILYRAGIYLATVLMMSAATEAANLPKFVGPADNQGADGVDGTATVCAAIRRVGR